uniref:Uncharacterized protein n=1 Tax=Arundo donax TaxID=35708 RepID=A0A0A9BGK1_ARUDO
MGFLKLPLSLCLYTTIITGQYIVSTFIMGKLIYSTP